jgi:hypothetical protein
LPHEWVSPRRQSSLFRSVILSEAAWGPAARQRDGVSGAKDLLLLFIDQWESNNLTTEHGKMHPQFSTRSRVPHPSQVLGAWVEKQ